MRKHMGRNYIKVVSMQGSPGTRAVSQTPLHRYPCILDSDTGQTLEPRVPTVSPNFLHRSSPGKGLASRSGLRRRRKTSGPKLEPAFLPFHTLRTTWPCRGSDGLSVITRENSDVIGHTLSLSCSHRGFPCP